MLSKKDDKKAPFSWSFQLIPTFASSMASAIKLLVKNTSYTSRCVEQVDGCKKLLRLWAAFSARFYSGGRARRGAGP